MATYPADLPGWCDAIAGDALPAAVAPRRRARNLPERDDLLGWSVLALTAPVVIAGALLLASQAALYLL